MPVTLNGAEYKRFFKDPAIWGADDGTTWVEEEEVEVDGLEVDSAEYDFENMPDTAVVKVTNGYLEHPPKGVNPDYEKTLRAWLRKQAIRLALFEVPADKLDALVAAAKALGAKVVR